MKPDITIEISNQQSALTINEEQLKEIVRDVIGGETRVDATISLAIVDDPTIHTLNRQYLEHDYVTDVLSFVLEENPLVGEVIASADTAVRNSHDFGWSPDEELILYFVHGALHLVGYDDHSKSEKQAMQQRETYYLSRHGIQRQDADVSKGVETR